MKWFVNPSHLLRLLQQARLPLGLAAGLLLGVGLVWGIGFAPPDYLQGESVRIMYLHVPNAWLAMLYYAILAACGGVYLANKSISTVILARAIAPVGFICTLVCLSSGSLWGIPTWGTAWVWDARLTAVALLAFLYAGYIALTTSQGVPDSAGAVLALLGLINLPIIKYSVEWWNTLHQPASISTLERLADPSIHSAMLLPLLVSFGGFWALTLLIISWRFEALLRHHSAAIRKNR